LEGRGDWRHYLGLAAPFLKTTSDALVPAETRLPGEITAVDGRTAAPTRLRGSLPPGTIVLPQPRSPRTNAIRMLVSEWSGEPEVMTPISRPSNRGRGSSREQCAIRHSRPTIFLLGPPVARAPAMLRAEESALSSFNPAIESRLQHINSLKSMTVEAHAGLKPQRIASTQSTRRMPNSAPASIRASHIFVKETMLKITGQYVELYVGDLPGGFYFVQLTGHTQNG